ncbi:hypothetical protein SUGI_0433570 [Cryptomeria japonica]|nr:hypothetical protein SUGI_0433570 [Cryptomeria japonica]
MTLIRANFPPYGKDFPGGIATGRFTNGKLVTDFLSSFVGLPDEVPANLDPQFTGEKLLTGASFGSAGAGIDNSTSVPPGTITLAQQYENFKSYRANLTDMVGEEESSKIVTEALFAISMGTNDFSENYYSNAVTRAKYDIEQFQSLLLQELQSFIQNIYKEGATKFLVIGVPPFGCLPQQITMHNLINGSCISEYNEVATSYNKKLSSLIEMMKPSLQGLQIVYIDVYDKLLDMIVNPNKYGFEEVRKGCCGTGLYEVGPLCNTFSKLCPNASTYVFWDSVHPTSATYNILANDIFKQMERLIRW